MRYANTLGVSLVWLWFGEGDQKVPPDIERLLKIPILGHVQAGEWQESVQHDVEEIDFIQIPRGSKYRDTPKFGLEVRGNSMNLKYPDGSIVICVRLFDIGKVIESGDVVVCNRSVATGTEVTLKEYVRTGDDEYLWPRSDDPEHQTPYKLIRKMERQLDEYGRESGGIRVDGIIGRENTVDEFNVTGLVIASYIES